MKVNDSGVPIYSSLEDSGQIAGLVAAFVRRLPSYQRKLQDAVAQSDWEVARHIAHQLRGAGGAYGYADLSDWGERFQTALTEIDENTSQQDQLFAELEQNIARIQLGIAEE